MSSISTRLRRAGIVGLSTVVAATMTSGLAVATPTFSFDRLAGTDRYATAVAVAQQYGAATNVILANGTSEHTVDALTAAYLSGVAKAPVMLTRLDATPANVLARLAASGATDVWLVGGTGVISAAQEAALDVNYTVHRLGGADRYLTAEQVIKAAAPSASTTALLATGTNFPDALGAGPLSYVKGMPVAITRATVLPDATLRALKAAGVTNVIALGGPTIVAQSVLNTLAANGISLNQRIYGVDRSETSTKLADYAITNHGFTNTAVNVASGEDTPAGADALGGAALSGKEIRPNIITRSITSIGNGILPFLTAHCSTLANGHIFGGLGAVSAASEAAMQAAARCPAATNQTYTVTPATAATIDLGSATTTRQYSVAVPSGTVASIRLFSATDVTNASGVYTFKDTDSNNLADETTNVGRITVVNGIAQTPAQQVDNVTSGGTITFTITAPSAVNVIPVVWADPVAGNDRLNLVVPSAANALPKAPSEAFGVAGQTNFISAGAPSGTLGADVAITSVDRAANLFMSATNTYSYDANDLFRIGGAPVTMADFEANLSTGDSLAAGSVYAADPALTSVLNLLNVTPSVPAALPTFGTPTATTVTVTSAASTGATSYVFLRSTTTGGPYTEVGRSDTAVFNDTGLTASTPYYYVTRGVVDGDESANSAQGTVTTTAVAGAAPRSVYAAQTTPAGLAGSMDSGDVIKVAFDSPLNSIADGDTIRVRDADGSLWDLTHGSVAGNTTFVRNIAAEVIGTTTYPINQVLTVTVGSTFAEVTAGTIAGLQYSGTVIDQSGIDGAGGLWNIAGSTDVTINQ